MITEILITCDTSLLEEYNSNTVNFIDDINEILSKSNKEICFVDFITKCTKNSNLIKTFFEIDEYILKLETIINQLDKFD